MQSSPSLPHEGKAGGGRKKETVGYERGTGVKTQKDSDRKRGLGGKCNELEKGPNCPQKLKVFGTK